MSTSLLLGWEAYEWDKNISARLCAKKAGGLMCVCVCVCGGGGGVFAGHYGICMKSVCPSMNDLVSLGSAFSEKLKVVRSPLMIFF